MSRNPLDPYAYEKEPHPFEAGRLVGGGGTSQHGVHTSPNFDVAVTYAIKRARQPDSGTGVVLVLDVDGLDPIEDIDAEVFARTGMRVFEEADFFNWDEVIEALEGDLDEAAPALRDALEALREEDPSMYEDEGPPDPEDYLSVYSYKHKLGDERKVIDVLLGLEDWEMVDELSSAYSGDRMSYYLWSQVIEQRRYFQPIGEDRLIEILCVWEPENLKDEPIVEVAWRNSELSRNDVDEIDYHGTDITRARKAFPGLDLKC